MGTVFLAEQVAVGNRPVAIKVLRRELLEDPEFLVRFRNEAASTGRIRHENVVTIYESGQSDNGSPYIAMEYLEGETLRDTLKTRGALPIAEVVEIIQQVARGLSAAHKLGIIHRDLKPENIFLTRDGEGGLAVKVVDFGIAKLRESSAHTLTGTVLGTPAYMSVEQASGMHSNELDARSDLYTLGIVAYELLTGQVPFQSDTPLGFLSKHLMEDPPPLRVVRPDMPFIPQLERVVMKALAKRREERFSSVDEFAREFLGQAQDAKANSGGPTRPFSPRTALDQAIPRLPKNKPARRKKPPTPTRPQTRTSFVPARMTGIENHAETGYLLGIIRPDSARAKIFRRLQTGVASMKELVDLSPKRAPFDHSKERYLKEYALPWLEKHLPQKGYELVIYKNRVELAKTRR